MTHEPFLIGVIRFKEGFFDFGTKDIETDLPVEVEVKKGGREDG